MRSTVSLHFHIRTLISVMVFLSFTHWNSISFSQSLKSDQSCLEYGTFLLEKNKLTEAEELFQNCIDSRETSADQLELYYRIAILYNTNLYFDVSIEYCLDVLQRKDLSIEDRRRFLHLITINHIDLNNLNQAEEYFWVSEKYKSEREEKRSNDYNIIGEIKRLKGEFKSASEYFQRAISINKSNASFDNLAMNYNNLALVYLSQNMFQESEDYLNRSLSIIDSLELKNKQAAINISYGRLYQAQKKYDKAKGYYRNIFKFDLSDHSDRIELLRDAHKGLFECFEQENKPKEALVNYKQAQEFNQLIYDREKQVSIFENQILFERKKHEEEVQLIRANNELEKKYGRMYLLVLCIGVVLLSSLVLLLRLRNKSIKQKMSLVQSNNQIQKLEIEKSQAVNERLQSEIREKEQIRKVEELEMQKLKSMIDSKNRELTSLAIHLSNKSETLAQISDKVTSMENWEEHPNLKEVQVMVSLNNQLDKDWNIFKKHFIEVHPDFFNSLIERFSELTNDDLKLCAYLKIQLSSKEIARLLNIETSAVNKRRNRLRKKLNMDSSENLHEFMMTLDKS